MFSKNLKKKVAVLLTGVMVLGMTVSASAAVGSPTGNGNKSGDGNFEGHVDRTVYSVVLPTIGAGDPFGYVMDSEGLITETKAVAYGGEDKIDASAKTDNVYFLKNDGKYYSESEAFTVSNNSTVSINVTVEVAAATTTAATDATLTNTKEEVTGDTAKLYLALKVDGEEDTVIKAGQTVSQSTVLDGKPENYIVSFNKATAGSYPHEYNLYLKDSELVEWDTVDFSLEGKANKITDASGVTAPNLTVTWKYSEYVAPAPESEEPETTTFEVTYNANGGVGDDQTEDVAENGNPSGPAVAFTREGYSLAGWAKTNDGEAAALNTFTITEATTLYAIWEQDAPAALQMQLVAATGNIRYVFSPAISGSLTALSIDGTNKPAMVTNEKATYNASNGNFVIKKEVVDSLMSSAGEYSIVATIGGAEYNFVYVVE